MGNKLEPLAHGLIVGLSLSFLLPHNIKHACLYFHLRHLYYQLSRDALYKVVVVSFGLQVLMRTLPAFS